MAVLLMLCFWITFRIQKGISHLGKLDTILYFIPSEKVVALYGNFSMFFCVHTYELFPLGNKYRF